MSVELSDAGLTRFAVLAASCKRGKKGGIPPTKLRAADSESKTRERQVAERERDRRPEQSDEFDQGVMRGHDRGRSRTQPAKTRRVAQDCDPKAIS